MVRIRNKEYEVILLMVYLLETMEMDDLCIGDSEKKIFNRNYSFAGN